LPAAGKVEVPIRMDDVSDVSRQPVMVLSIKAEIEDPDCRILPIGPDRQDSIAQQREIDAVRAAGD